MSLGHRVGGEAEQEAAVRQRDEPIRLSAHCRREADGEDAVAHDGQAAAVAGDVMRSRLQLHEVDEVMLPTAAVAAVSQVRGGHTHSVSRHSQTSNTGDMYIHCSRTRLNGGHRGSRAGSHHVECGQRRHRVSMSRYNAGQHGRSGGADAASDGPACVGEALRLVRSYLAALTDSVN